jgi:hypothetical protein
MASAEPPGIRRAVQLQSTLRGETIVEEEEQEEEKKQNESGEML